MFTTAVGQCGLVRTPGVRSGIHGCLVKNAPQIRLARSKITCDGLSSLGASVAYFVRGKFYQFGMGSRLISVGRRSPGRKRMPMRIGCTFSRRKIDVDIRHYGSSTCLILPIVTSPGRRIEVDAQRTSVGGGGKVLCVAYRTKCVSMTPASDSKQVFGPIPKFSFMPLQVVPRDVNGGVRVGVCFYWYILFVYLVVSCGRRGATVFIDTFEDVVPLRIRYQYR